MTPDQFNMQKPSLNMLLEQAQEAAKELQRELNFHKNTSANYPFFNNVGRIIYRVEKSCTEKVAECSDEYEASKIARLMNKHER